MERPLQELAQLLVVQLQLQWQSWGSGWIVGMPSTPSGNGFENGSRIRRSPVVGST
jgi:hypothetical protein